MFSSAIFLNTLKYKLQILRPDSFQHSYVRNLFVIDIFLYTSVNGIKKTLKKNTFLDASVISCNAKLPQSDSQ